MAENPAVRVAVEEGTAATQNLTVDLTAETKEALVADQNLRPKTNLVPENARAKPANPNHGNVPER